MTAPVARPPLRTTLPARFYTDAACYRREMERFFFNGWICAGRADQIPARGDFFVRDVAGESVIVVRADAPVIRAVYNVCRHRGTRMCEAAAGTFAGSIQCPYHAWTYDLHGQLIGAPHMDAVAGFDRRDYPLRGVAVELWDGHIFINLSLPGRDRHTNEPPPLRPLIAPLVERFRPWGMDALRLGHRAIYDVRANWKLIVQNYNECLHCPVLHPLLTRMHDYLGAENVPSGPGFCGGSMALQPGVETLSTDGKRRRRLLPGLGDAERSIVSYFTVYPNLLLTLHPDYMVTVTIWPVAPDRTTLICEWHFHPDDMAREDFVSEDAVAFWETTNREDWHISELSQAGIASRAYAPGPYSAREGLLWDFDEMIRRAAETS